MAEGDGRRGPGVGRGKSLGCMGVGKAAQVSVSLMTGEEATSGETKTRLSVKEEDVTISTTIRAGWLEGVEGHEEPWKTCGDGTWFRDTASR